MTTINEDATEDDRWLAVTERDGRADGAFLYAVKTTGVFCRPTCPSRLPNRFTGTSVFCVRGGQIVEEIGEEGAARWLRSGFWAYFRRLNSIFRV